MHEERAAGHSAYLRLSVTDRCNLRCLYCRPERGGATRGSGGASDVELLGLVDLLAEGVPLHKVRLTGGEPLVRPGLADLVARLRRRLPRATLALTTNAILLGEHAADLRRAGLDALNVSLDATDPEAFRAVTRGGHVAAAIDGLRAAREAGFRGLKINTVLIRRLNGDRLTDLVELAAREECEIRFIELMPCGEGAALHETDYLSAAEALERLVASLEHIGPEPRSATAERHRFRVHGRETTVGFISAVSRPFCHGCDRLRLDSRGRLVACLRSEEHADLLEPYRRGDVETARRRIREAIASKSPPGARWPRRPMVALGG